MKGSDRYVETVEGDRKGRDKGQDKVKRTFYFNCLVGVSQQVEERILIKMKNLMNFEEVIIQV